MIPAVSTDESTNNSLYDIYELTKISFASTMRKQQNTNINITIVSLY